LALRIPTVHEHRRAQSTGCLAPCPQRHHASPTLALRPPRLRERHLALGDPLLPLSEQPDPTLAVEPADVARHERHRAAGLQAFAPRFYRISFFHENFRDGPHPRRAERVAGLAGAGLDRVAPLALARPRPQRTLAPLGHAEEREPRSEEHTSE